jgi:fibronectin-binding autotransporter adhesin
MSYLGLDPNTPLLNTSTETFSGTGAQLQFTLARSIATASDIDVMIGSTLQRPFTDYTANNTTLLFVSAPGAGTNNITVTYRAGALNSLDLSVSVFQAGTVGAPGVVSVAANNTGFYWANATTLVATVAGSNRATFNGLATSTSSTSGALTVQGGIGVAGNINGNGIIKTTNTTESFAVSSGALQLAGGAGIVGNLNVGGDITCVGDFTVNGTFTTTGTDSLDVTDPFIFLANANPGDTFDTGVVAQYNDGAITRYTGYFRDITDTKYKLFGNLTVKPSTTVDTLDPSFEYNDLILANLSATGNISGTYLVGNGFFLTGLQTSPTRIFNSASEVTIPSPNGNITANVSAATITTTYNGGFNVTGQISTTGNILTPLTATVATGNITAGSTISATGNIASLANIAGANLLTGGLISAVANIDGGNLRTAGQVSAGGNITGGNIRTVGLISATGDLFADNASFATVIATGNIQGGNLNSDADIVATTGIYAGTIVSAVGNVIGGNINTAGLASVAGNVVAGNLRTSGQIVSTRTGVATDGLGQIYLNGTGNNRIDFNTNGVAAPAFTTRSAGTKITLYPSIGASATDYAFGVEAGALWSTIPGNDGGQYFKWYGATTQVAYLSGIGVFSALGNIIGANINTAGVVSATGNVIGGNIETAGLITATGTITGANITGANLLTGGIVSAGGNITGANLITSGLATVTGNITGGNIITGGAVSATGAISATANVIGGNIQTTGSITAGLTISATGNITGGNVNTAGLISTTGNITSAANIAGGNVLSTLLVQGSILSATANIFSSANITATDAFLGARLSLSGNVISQIATTSNIAGGNLNTFGLVSATGNLTTATGNLNAGNAIISTLVQGTTLSASGNIVGANANISTTTNLGVGSVGYLSVLGSASDPIVRGAGSATVGLIFSSAGTGNYVFNNGSSVTLGTNTGMTVNGFGQNYLAVKGGGSLSPITLAAEGTDTNIAITVTPKGTGNVNTGANISATGTITGGNVRTGGLVSATGNITGGNISTGGTIDSSGASTAGSYSTVGNITGGNVLGGANVNAVLHSGTTVSVTGTITGASVVGGVMTGTSLSVTGNITGGNILGGANVNATTHTGTTVSVTGNIDGGNLRTAGLISATGSITGGAITGSSLNITTGTANLGNITNANGNGIGNIGNSTVYFNTVFAKATSAQYADLAENYLADAEYPPGTVVSFGGDQEVTVSHYDNDKRVAGVVSTNPSYIMNSGLQGEHVVIVALTGRVPTRVLGPVRKGDMMVSAGYGLARSESAPEVGAVLGKALADFSGTEGVIEVVVGKI